MLAKVVALQRKLQYNEGLVQFSLMLEKNSPETCLELAPSTSLAQIKEDVSNGEELGDSTFLLTS